MATNGKDVIYVDVDDEITGIIDKVTNSDSKIVALVLPKRATVFQSIVNMKLLKKRADAAKKQPVLITSEAGLLPMAGTVGLYVAKTLQSKPEIPEAVAAAAVGAAGLAIHHHDEFEKAAEAEFDAAQSGDTPVGDLAGEHHSVNDDGPEDTIEIDNSDSHDGGPGKAVTAEPAAAAPGKSGTKKGKNKHLRVPNFDKFRLKLVLGILGVALLIILWILANNVLPKATVTVKTDTSNVNSSLTPTLDTTATSVDTTAQIVPAKVATVQKSYSAQVSASGKKNNGSKATGSVQLSAQACAPNLDSPNVPAGSGLSANGLTFITQEDANFHLNGASGSCVNWVSGPVDITAQDGGTQYNLGNGTNFTVAGQSGVTGSGSTSGGTDNIVTVVQQSDIDNAKKQAEQGIDKSALKQQLQQQLQGEGQYALTATFVAQKPNITTSVKAGDQASNVSFNENVTYTMFGVQKSDLDKLIQNSVDQQIDTNKQSIQDDGLDNANITMPSPGSTTKTQVDIEVTSVIGPHLDKTQLKKSIEGDKAGEARSAIKGNPGVIDVQVHFSPFWVDTVPKNPNKITIQYSKSSGNDGQ